MAQSSACQDIYSPVSKDTNISNFPYVVCCIGANIVLVSENIFICSKLECELQVKVPYAKTHL